MSDGGEVYIIMHAGDTRTHTDEKEYPVQS